MEFTAVRVGDVLTGTIVERVRSGARVSFGGFDGFLGPLDLSWRFPARSADVLQVGAQVIAEVIEVDREQRRVQLSRAATEHPELWSFLKALRRGQRLSGTVAAIESFGVFVALDDGPEHPTFAGVGFITAPELSWTSFEDYTDVVAEGQRVTCEFLAFDTTNGEARLSLRAVSPDPFVRFAETHQAGQILPGLVTKLVPFGAFLRVDGIEGLLHRDELRDRPVEVGDKVTVAILEIELPGRRLLLSRR